MLVESPADGQGTADLSIERYFSKDWHDREVTQVWIKAYINSCLHRGTMLRTGGGCVQRLRCPFDGWTWTLDGKLAHIAQQWDMTQELPACAMSAA